MKLLNNTYFTNDNAVELVYNNMIKNNININDYDIILEPSAGDGAFINCKHLTEHINHNNIIALDINPLGLNIIKQDFLKYDTSHLVNKKVLVIGNPPFSPISLLHSFLKKICKICDAFVLILPISFKKESRSKMIDLYFHLIDVIDIPKNAYRYDNKIYDVNTAIFIYKKEDFKRDKPVIYKPIKYGFSDDKKDYEIVIWRVGSKASLINASASPNKNNNYFIKLYDIRKEDFIKNYNRHIDLLKENINKTVGQKSLSKNNIIEYINKYVSPQ